MRSSSIADPFLHERSRCVSSVMIHRTARGGTRGDYWRRSAGRRAVGLLVLLAQQRHGLARQIAIVAAPSKGRVLIVPLYPKERILAAGGCDRFAATQSLRHGPDGALLCWQRIGDSSQERLVSFRTKTLPPGDHSPGAHCPPAIREISVGVSAHHCCTRSLALIANRLPSDVQTG